METTILFDIFISGLLVSFTGYALIYLFWAIFSTTTRSIRGTLNNFIL